MRRNPRNQDEVSTRKIGSEGQNAEGKIDLKRSRKIGRNLMTSRKPKE